MSQTEKLRKLIIKDPLLAIDELLKVSDTFPTIRDDSIALHRQAEELKSKEIRGELTFEQISNKKSQITSNALAITNDIEKLESQEHQNHDNKNETKDTSKSNWQSVKNISINIAITVTVVGGIGAGLYFLFDLFLILLLILLGVLIFQHMTEGGGE